MKLLHTLSPAESILITQPQHSDHIDLLLTTFMDLWRRQIIALETQNRAYTPGRSQLLTYVVPGKEIRSYHALPHESIFTDIIEESAKKRVLFEHMIRKAYDKDEGLKELKEEMILIPRIARFFHYSWLGFFWLTKTGKQAKQEIEASMAPLEKEVLKMSGDKKEDVRQLLFAIQGNTALLDREVLSLFKRVKRQFIAERKMTYKARVSTSGETYVFRGKRNIAAMVRDLRETFARRPNNRKS